MDVRNIILVQCDSMDGRVMGCMGHRAVRNATPNMDRMARNGVLFANAYSNNPICCPSRASTWSGLYTHHCEAWNNYKGLEPGDPTFMTRLNEAGYKTQCFGKTDYLSGQHTVRARVSPWTRSANILKPNYSMKAPRTLDSMERRIQKRDWDVVDRSIEWLEQAAEEQRPFCLYIGLEAPHPPFIASRYYLDMIDEEGVTVPPEDKQDHPVMYYQRINKNWTHGFSEDMVKLTRKIYFAMIAEVDAMLGEILGAVERLGLSDSTYVIFTSDHGELALEHRQYYKMNMYEPAVRVPLIVTGPDIERNKRVDNLVSLIDIYPTLMDMAAQNPLERLDGHSLMPELAGGINASRPEWVFSEFHDTSCNTGVFMVRKGDWKYVAYPGYEPQLFNLADDPWEIINLSAQHPKKVAEMDALLRSIVDYEAVDAKVKAYDRESFRKWRQEQKELGTYWAYMSRIFSGWDDLAEDQVQPWTEEDEKNIEQWLNS